MILKVWVGFICELIDFNNNKIKIVNIKKKKNVRCLS